ncbi:MAG: 3-dehydroquinate synthase [Ardenticatenaceae bacterium]|nr:3-dehydroquinate synthase [Ardenticatenaceae bacterium]MCB9445619.1 3-dehydroquinate synthase [Ardenticatenaceae bacterium]
MMNDELLRLPVNYPGGQYDVIVGAGLLPRLQELADVTGPLAVVTDSNVGLLYAGQVADADCVITVPAGEQYKTLATIQTIYDELLAAGLDRKGTVVALGGGVVGDMAGFAAATYMRGVAFVQCPTSLLAMVDASVGAKTGVDLPQGKNLVGAFKQPQAVLADIATLKTLPPPEFAAGMAEVVKHGLIANPGLFERLMIEDFRLTESSIINTSTSLSTSLQSLIIDAIQVKRDVVQEDPFEQGRRATLNLGHTFGHAIEQVSGYAVRHGEGVAIGLVAAANLSARLGYCDPDLQPRIEMLLTKLHLPTRIPVGLSHAHLYGAMGSDKKKAAGQLRFVLLRGIGDVFVTGDVAETAVFQTLAAVTA